MRRRIAGIFAVLSLLLSVGFVAAMVRSVWVDDRLWWQRWDETGLRRLVVVLESDAGAVYLSVLEFHWETDPKQAMSDREVYPDGCGVSSGHRTAPWWPLSFRWHFGGNPNLIYRSVGVPVWLPAVLSAILPAWHARSLLRQRRRRKLGLCLRCGYDLRASAERCPECGEVISTTKDTNGANGAAAWG